jgi:hypothetical protein
LRERNETFEVHQVANRRVLRRVEAARWIQTSRLSIKKSRADKGGGDVCGNRVPGQHGAGGAPGQSDFTE